MTLWTEKLLQRWVDEFQSDPKNFLKQKGRPVQSIMESYWSELKDSDHFMQKYYPKIRNETVGNPLKFVSDNRMAVLTVQHLYHMYNMEINSGFDPIEMDLIVEIGGGYGNLCRLIMEHGFSGTYVIVDFPEQFEAQTYFLSNNGVDMDRVKFIPLELDKIQTLIDCAEKSLLVGTFSINEMPMSDRKHLENYYQHFDHLYIEYNRDFDGISNVEYFDKLRLKLSNEFEMKSFKDPHYRGNGAWFMVGSKK